MDTINFFVENKTIFIVLHILSVVIGMGSALISDFFFNFYSRDKNLSKEEIGSLELLSKIVWVSLVFIILSGVALFFSDPQKYMDSNKFISKMFIMVVLLVNGLFLSKFIAPHFTDKGLLKFKNKRSIRQVAFICGSISLISWIVVCVLGVLKSISLHFSQFILYYIFTIIFSGIIALVLEKIIFSKK